MKVGVIFFHSKINEIYPKEWVDECISSIKNQTVDGLEIYEIDYSGEGINLTGTQNHYSLVKKNYADAMNFIITEAFKDQCDFVFNTNMDDRYPTDRIEKQLDYLKNGYDIVSSDFIYINEKGEFLRNFRVSQYNTNIKEQLQMDHNVIAHPCVGYSRNFWNTNRYDILKTPEEDLDMWKRSIGMGYKFYIVPEILLEYRIHEKQVSNKKN